MRSRHGAVDARAPTGPAWMTNGRGASDLYGVNEDVVGYTLIGDVIVCRLTGRNVLARAGP